MKTKFLIPVLAMIIGIGMSFTTAELGEAQSFDYILMNGQWSEIPHVECGSGQLDCRVLQNGIEYEVYDTKNLQSIKDTDNPNPFEI